MCISGKEGSGISNTLAVIISLGHLPPGSISPQYFISSNRLRPLSGDISSPEPRLLKDPLICQYKETGSLSLRAVSQHQATGSIDVHMLLRWGLP